MIRRPSILILAALFSGSLIPLFSFLHLKNRKDLGKSATEPRRLVIEVTNSDDFAKSELTVESSGNAPGFGAADHERVEALLANTRELVEKAQGFTKSTDEEVREEGKKMMTKAHEMYNKVKDHINNVKEMSYEETDTRDLMGGDSISVQRDEAKDQERAMDVSRLIYSTAITFPECIEKFLNHCVALINRDLRKLGMDTIDMIIHEKRSLTPDQEGYNKVVIITNELGDRVTGRLGDGIVSYPYIWNDVETGPRQLGVDGKWNCLGLTPDQCCSQITESCPNIDRRNNTIACHIFVPYGGVREKRDDRVIINLSTDGRVHEAPIIT